MSEFEPDEEGQSRLIEQKEIECYGCGDTIDTDHDRYLVSRVWLLWKRYRCEKCGKRHEKFGREEMREKWVAPQKRRRRL